MTKTILLIFFFLSIFSQDANSNSSIKPKPYLKITRDSKEVKLYLSIRQFKPNKKKGPIIYLTSASHIGDIDYYSTLQKHLNKQTLVLFEGAGSPNFTEDIENNETAKRKNKVTKESMIFLTEMLEKYKNKNKIYPKNLLTLEKWLSTQNGRYGGWTKKAIIDRWGKKIEYYSHDNKYLLTCYGSDFKSGGEKYAKDIIMTSEVELKKDSGSSLQTDMAHSLGLEFQLNAINYNFPNFKNSDLSNTQMEKIFNGKYLEGTDFKDKKSRKKLAKDLTALVKMMSGSSFMGKIAQFFFKILGFSKTARSLVKLMIIETLENTKGDMTKIASKDPKMGRILKILVSFRNNIVINDIKKSLKILKENETVSIFYGAGHMFGLEKDLKEKLDYTEDSEIWIPCFSVVKSDTSFSDFQLEIFRQTLKKELDSKIKK
jgi:hypothetical protein